MIIIMTFVTAQTDETNGKLCESECYVTKILICVAV